MIIGCVCNRASVFSVKPVAVLSLARRRPACVHKTHTLSGHVTKNATHATIHLTTTTFARNQRQRQRRYRRGIDFREVLNSRVQLAPIITSSSYARPRNWLGCNQPRTIRSPECHRRRCALCVQDHTIAEKQVVDAVVVVSAGLSSRAHARVTMQI